jgi:uncharacterized protein DUF5134
MPAPSWLSLVLAAAMLVVAACCAGRLAAASVLRRPSELDADGVHVVMGVAMAGALAPRLSFPPASAQEVVFALAAAWFAGQVIRVRGGSGAGGWRCPHPAPHLAESLAMVYMAAAARVPGSGTAGAVMAGMDGGSGLVRFPAVAVVFALFMVGYAIWLGDRFVSLSRPAAAATAPEAAMSPAMTPVVPGFAGAAGTRVPAAGRPGGAGDEHAGPAGGPAPASQARRGSPVLAPRAAVCYKIAMAVTMAYMLITMV